MALEEAKRFVQANLCKLFQFTKDTLVTKYECMQALQSAEGDVEVAKSNLRRDNAHVPYIQRLDAPQVARNLRSRDPLAASRA